MLNKTVELNDKQNLRQGIGQITSAPRLVSSRFPNTLSFLQNRGGEPMKKSWVERSQGSYVVKTGDITPFGFVNVKKMDRFPTLPEANKKAEVANYIWGKIAKISATMILAIFLYGSAFAFTTEASYYTVASCKREGTSGIMANGKELKDEGLICASWDYSFGTRLRITNLANKRSVVVYVSDRGPSKRLYAKGRRIDLSKRAFNQIANLKQGVIQVSVEVDNE